MNTLAETAPAFVEMAHQIVWCSVASVDKKGRPRSRILHPIWEWDGENLIGWIDTGPTPMKRAHIKHTPFLSLNYWAPSQDTCMADCRVEWKFDLETRQLVWDKFKNGPEPVGYDPSLIPAWTSPAADAFAVLKLDPWHLRVFPGSLLLQQTGTVLNWYESKQ